MERLENELSAGNQEVGGAVQEAEQLRRRNTDLDQERRMLEDRLENSKSLAESLRKKGREAEERIGDVLRRLDEAEKGRKEAEDRLVAAGSNSGADNYLKVDDFNFFTQICVEYAFCT